MYTLRWSLVEGVAREAADGVLTITTARLRVRYPDPAGLLTRAVERLASDRVDWDELLDAAVSATDVAHLDYRLTRLRSAGFLRCTLDTPEGPLATRIPTAHREPPRPASTPRPRALSRFAHLRREADGLRLETPLAPCRVLLHDWRGPALLACLHPADSISPGTSLPPADAKSSTATSPPVAAPIPAGTPPPADAPIPAGTPPPADAAIPPGIPRAVAEAFFLLLDEAGMCGPDPAYWEFHDLVFHAASRLGRHDRPYGGTYPHRERCESPPPLRAALSDDRIPLPVPDLARLMADDPPLAAVVERRRSGRQHGETPIALAQLGEFLYRTCRFIEMRGDGIQLLPRRPHANAGALYELETYLTIDRAEGLEPDIYRYVPEAHALERLHTSAEARAAMLDFVRRGSGSERPPQVLVTLTSRIGRLAWKYAAIAYASTLKDVGIVLHTMYLAATAMGLAACAVGGGDSDLFATTVGHDYYEETAVGEFMLGLP